MIIALDKYTLAAALRAIAGSRGGSCTVAAAAIKGTSSDGVISGALLLP